MSSEEAKQKLYELQDRIPPGRMGITKYSWERFKKYRYVSFLESHGLGIRLMYPCASPYDPNRAYIVHDTYDTEECRWLGRE